MNLEQAFAVIKKASEAAPMAKEGHVIVEQALKLIAEVLSEKIKASEHKEVAAKEA